MDFVEQSYWDKSYEDLGFQAPGPHDPMRKWLETYVGRGMGRCLEIGCFPGGILSILGEFGYEVHGIDLTPRVVTDLPRWLESKGYKVGQFIQGDALNFHPEMPYELVASFGFIEHFSNWREVILKHALLVKKSGLLVLEAPNFRGVVQRFLHTWLDNENYKKHNIDSMQPFLWKEILEESGFEVLYCGYFGNFDFWVDDAERNWFQRLIINLIQSSKKRFLKYLPNSRAYSPLCGLICRKKS